MCIIYDYLPCRACVVNSPPPSPKFLINTLRVPKTRIFGESFSKKRVKNILMDHFGQRTYSRYCRMECSEQICRTLVDECEYVHRTIQQQSCKRAPGSVLRSWFGSTFLYSSECSHLFLRVYEKYTWEHCVFYGYQTFTHTTL